MPSVRGSRACPYKVSVFVVMILAIGRGVLAAEGRSVRLPGAGAFTDFLTKRRSHELAVMAVSDHGAHAVEVAWHGIAGVGGSVGRGRTIRF